MILERVDALVCDLDGVVYRGDDRIPGAPEALAALRARGLRVLFVTNNSRPTVAQYLDKLRAMDVEVAADEIITSAVVTAEVLEERGFAGARAIVVGGGGLREELARVGVTVDDDPKVRGADVVVVGWDPRFDYDAMRRAALAVRAGAAFFATNDDAAYPAPGGELWPGAGAILASIETTAARRAEVMGKPHAPMMAAAARRLGDAARVALVGDRPETDLAGGKARGWVTVLVLSGVTAPDEVDRSEMQPDVVVADLAALDVLLAEIRHP